MWPSIFIRFKEAVTISQVLTTASVIMVGIVAWVTGGFVSLVIENEVLQVPYQQTRFVPPKFTIQDKPRQFSEFSTILEQNIFNAEVSAPKKQEVVRVVEQVAPGKQLNDILNNLELLGINYRRNYYILCIIRDKRKNNEDIFTIGDEVFDTGATVNRIFTTFGNQRVLIQLGSEVGTLEYADEDEHKNSPQTNRPPVKRASVVKRPAPPLNSEYSSDGKNFNISASEVDTHLNDFGSLLNQARMVPYFKNSKHQGFRVKAIDKGSLYEKLGLQNNDILKAVNGESLAEAGGEKLMGLFKLLRNEREFTVEIERGGQSQVLNYYVN